MLCAKTDNNNDDDVLLCMELSANVYLAVGRL